MFAIPPAEILHLAHLINQRVRLLVPQSDTRWSLNPAGISLYLCGLNHVFILIGNEDGGCIVDAWANIVCPYNQRKTSISGFSGKIVRDTSFGRLVSYQTHLDDMEEDEIFTAFFRFKPPIHLAPKIVDIFGAGLCENGTLYNY